MNAIGHWGGDVYESDCGGGSRRKYPRLRELVWKTLCALVWSGGDVQFSLGPMDTMDHAARMQTSDRRWGSMKSKWASEVLPRRWPDEI